MEKFQPWLYVAIGVLVYFYVKIKKLYKDAKEQDNSLSLLPFIGNFLATDVEDVLLSVGLVIWIVTGHTIVGFSIDLSNELQCIMTGIAIPYAAVNIVLSTLSTIPIVNVGDRTRRKARKKTV